MLDSGWLKAFGPDRFDNWLVVLLFCAVSLAFLLTGMSGLPSWVHPALWLGFILSTCVFAVGILEAWLGRSG